MSPKKSMIAGLLLAGASLVAPVSAQWNPFDTCRDCAPPQVFAPNPCVVCPQQPVYAPVQQPVFQQHLQPQVRTRMMQKQVVRYRTVPQIQQHRQAYTENVPVTSYQTVQVDEGAYQQVWVPKMVQKQVPTTVMQQQLKYRNVAVQTLRQVAVAETQLVPQQTVEYVPQTRFAGMQTVGSQLVGWQGGAPQMAGWGYAPAATAYGYPAQPMMGYAPQIYPSTAAYPGLEPIAAEPTPATESAGIDRPTPAPSDGWQTIRQGSNSNGSTQQSYNPQPTRAADAPTAVRQSQVDSSTTVR